MSNNSWKQQEWPTSWDEGFPEDDQWFQQPSHAMKQETEVSKNQFHNNYQQFPHISDTGSNIIPNENYQFQHGSSQQQQKQSFNNVSNPSGFQNNLNYHQNPYSNPFPGNQQFYEHQYNPNDRNNDFNKEHGHLANLNSCLNLNEQHNKSSQIVQLSSQQYKEPERCEIPRTESQVSVENKEFSDKNKLKLLFRNSEIENSTPSNILIPDDNFQNNDECTNFSQTCKDEMEESVVSSPFKTSNYEISKDKMESIIDPDLKQVNAIKPETLNEPSFDKSEAQFSKKTNVITSHTESPFKPPIKINSFIDNGNNSRISEIKSYTELKEKPQLYQMEKLSLFTPQTTPDFSPIVTCTETRPNQGTPPSRRMNINDVNIEDKDYNNYNNYPTTTVDKNFSKTDFAANDIDLQNNEDVIKKKIESDDNFNKDLDNIKLYDENKERRNESQSDAGKIENKFTNFERNQRNPEEYFPHNYSHNPNSRVENNHHQNEISNKSQPLPQIYNDNNNLCKTEKFRNVDRFDQHPQHGTENFKTNRSNYDQSHYKVDENVHQNYNYNPNSRSSAISHPNELSNRTAPLLYDKDQQSRPIDNYNHNITHNDYRIRNSEDYPGVNTDYRRSRDSRYVSDERDYYYRQDDRRGRDRRRYNDDNRHPDYYANSREQSRERHYKQREHSFDRNSYSGRPISRGSAYDEDYRDRPPSRPLSRQGYDQPREYSYHSDYDQRYKRGYEEEMNAYRLMYQQQQLQQQQYQMYQKQLKEWEQHCKRLQESAKLAVSRGSTPAIGGAAENFAGSRPNSQLAMIDPYIEERRTPLKFSFPHTRCNFGSGGQLIKIFPNRPADGQPALVQIQRFHLSKDAEELSRFPGPLIRGETHKNDVLRFCDDEIKKNSQTENVIDRESVKLLWNLLQLLIKQNGIVIGSDIADFLLAGHEPTTSDFVTTGLRNNTSVSTTVDSSSVNMSDNEIIDRYRHLLLFGRKKDALEWAFKQNLWGHALFLSSKMDLKTHAAVLTKFANSAMKINDPLQTLYQLMSGRQPAAVTLVSDARWGDWRPHLAMILANSTSKPDLDSKSICVLGDTLSAKGCLYAAHICYLLAKVPPGSLKKLDSKYVLLSSFHRLRFNEFANNSAIQCTEIYEYASSLAGNDENFTILVIRLMPYKFLYAVRLYSAGLIEEAFHYCEVLAKTIVQLPNYCNYSLITGVHKIANQLKYHTYEKGLYVNENDNDPQWLIELTQLVSTLNIQTPYIDLDSINQCTVTDQWQEEKVYNQGPQQPVNDEIQNDENDIDNDEIDNESVKLHSQMNDENLPEDTGNNYENKNIVNSQKQKSTDFAIDENYYGNNTQRLRNRGTNEHLDLGASMASTSRTRTSSSRSDIEDVLDLEKPADPFNTIAKVQHLRKRLSSSSSPRRSSVVNMDSLETSPPLSPRSYNSTQTTLPSTSYSNYSYSTGSNTLLDNNVMLSSSQTSAITNQRRRTTSKSSQSSNSSNRQLDQPQQQPNNNFSIQQQNQQVQQQQQKFNHHKGTSWFGKMIQSVIPKGKNEMILPDDKDPSIIFDDKRKCWINKETNEEIGGIASAPPPPTASDIVPVTQQSSNNPFSRNFKRGQYVDVLAGPNQSNIANTQPPVPGLFPTYSSNSGQNIFNPMQVVSGNNQPEEYRDTVNQTIPGNTVNSSQPMMFNPNQFNNPTSFPMTSNIQKDGRHS